MDTLVVISLNLLWPLRKSIKFCLYSNLLEIATPRPFYASVKSIVFWFLKVSRGDKKTSESRASLVWCVNFLKVLLALVVMLFLTYCTSIRNKFNFGYALVQGLRHYILLFITKTFVKKIEYYFFLCWNYCLRFFMLWTLSTLVYFMHFHEWIFLYE